MAGKRSNKKPEEENSVPYDRYGTIENNNVPYVQYDSNENSVPDGTIHTGTVRYGTTGNDSVQTGTVHFGTESPTLQDLNFYADVFKELQLRELATNSFHEFVKQAWPHIEGDNEFIDNWHIQALCSHLDACYRRQIYNLMIHVPPRTMKSTLTSVMFPAWVWLHNPAERFLYASYAASLSVRDSLKCRRLISSPWYQTRWGHLFHLMPDNNLKSRFENDKGGYRIAGSVGSSITGEGGTIIICFPFDVIINTNIGDLKIGEIVESKIECKILSFNHTKNEFEYKQIEEYQKSYSNELIEIELDDRIIECTPDHPIYVVGKGYIEAKNICLDDEILCL